MKRTLIIILFFLEAWEGINSIVLSIATTLSGSDVYAQSKGVGFLPERWAAYIIGAVTIAMAIDKQLRKWIEKARGELEKITSQATS